MFNMIVLFNQYFDKKNVVSNIEKMTTVPMLEI